MVDNKGAKADVHGRRPSLKEVQQVFWRLIFREMRNVEEEKPHHINVLAPVLWFGHQSLAPAVTEGDLHRELKGSSDLPHMYTTGVLQEKLIKPRRVWKIMKDWSQQVGARHWVHDVSRKYVS